MTSDIKDPLSKVPEITLGTALGDWTTDSAGLGYLGAAGIFAALLAIVVFAHFYTKISKILLFWTAFVLTRPLGAVIGHLLDKPAIQGGLELSRYHATAFLFLLIIACIYAFPQHPAQASH